jgi:hypothetical protein
MMKLATNATAVLLSVLCIAVVTVFVVIVRKENFDDDDIDTFR